MVDGGAYDPDKAYKDSKLCDMLFMLEAARRGKGKLTANSFSPGPVSYTHLTLPTIYSV